MGENHTLTPPPSLAWQLCIQVPCMAISYFFEKSPLGYRLPLLTSPQLSTQSNSLARDYLGHGQPWNISFPSSRGHPAPQFLWYCPSQRPVPQLGYAASCVSPTVFLLPPPSKFTCPDLCWHKSETSLLCEGSHSVAITDLAPL